MSAHTPGPWRAENIGAGTEAWGVVATSGVSVVEHDFVGGHDAFLIAAAPDLLDACVEFVRKCECGEARSTRSYQQMKAAIQKAEGVK